MRFKKGIKEINGAGLGFLDGIGKGRIDKGHKDQWLNACLLTTQINTPYQLFCLFFGIDIRNGKFFKIDVFKLGDKAIAEIFSSNSSTIRNHIYMAFHNAKSFNKME